MPKQTTLHNSDWASFDHPAMTLECCDCCLTHTFILKFHEGVPYLQVFRDDVATDEARDHMPKKLRRKIIEALGGTLT